MEHSELQWLLEESDAIYHRAVTEVQIEAQKQKEEAKEKNRREMDDYLDHHLEDDYENVGASFFQQLEIRILRIQRSAAVSIHELLKVRKNRDTAILEYAQKDR